MSEMSELDCYYRTLSNSNLSQTEQIIQLRKQAQIIRRSISIQERLDAEQNVITKIKTLTKLNSASHIGIYLSFDGEFETRSIIDYLWQQNKQVYLPVVINAPQPHLEFIHYTQQTKLIKSKLGFDYPAEHTPKILLSQLEIIFTPLTVYDERFYRIGLAFSQQKLKHIPNQPWDQKLNIILSQE